MSKKYKVFLAVGLCCLSLTGCTSAYEAYEEGYKDALHDAEDYVQEEIVMFYEGYCWKCGKENRDSAAFCRYCGVSLNIWQLKIAKTQQTTN